MQKLIAILNVVAWSGFWAFGYIALTANTADGAQMVTATILAALGGAVGLWAYFQLRWAQAVSWLWGPMHATS